MDKYAFRAVSVFVALMVLCTLFSWKLDELRTPQIISTEPTAGLVDGQPYSRMVPNEAMAGGGVWVLQANTSAFQPLTVRRSTPNIQAADSRYTAVDGLGTSRIVWFSDRPLTAGQVVEYWPGDSSFGRVEILGASEAEALLRERAQEYGDEWEISREDGRLVISNAGRFAAQQAEAALAGIDAVVLDYSWGEAVLAQTKTLWLVWAGFLALILLWWLTVRQAKAGLARFRAASREQYPKEYLAENGIGLLLRLIGLLVLIFFTAAAVQWVWQVKIAMPTGFLPDGSVFQLEHYRAWCARTFPEGMLSGYAAELAQNLHRWTLISGLAMSGMTVIFILAIVGTKIRRK